MLDAIRYINLDTRPDRLPLVEGEIECFLKAWAPAAWKRWETLQPPGVQRLPGIPTGAVGCSQSHLRAARDVVDRGYGHLLVLEDDFAWTADPHDAAEQIIAFLDAYGGTYGICQIAHSPGSLRSATLTSTPGLLRVRKSSNGGGYLISRQGAEALIPLYEHAFGAAVQPPPWDHWNFMYDVIWNAIKGEVPCFAFEPRLARQRAGKSDLCAEDWTDYG